MKASRSFAALSGVAIYFGVAAAVVAVTRRARGQAIEDERHAEELRRHAEALKLHDSVVQGIAACIWMLDADCKEGALEALTTTMGVAQHLVSELLGPEEIVPGSLVVPVDVSAA